MRMKKFLCVTFSLVLLAGFAGCNRQVVDITYVYDRAIIQLPSGEIVEGAVDSWRDYKDGDQIQVKIDGVTYLVHSANVVLINE